MVTVNVVVLAGTVAADPVARRMPSGDEVTSHRRRSKHEPDLETAFPGRSSSAYTRGRSTQETAVENLDDGQGRPLGQRLLIGGVVAAVALLGLFFTRPGESPDCLYYAETVVNFGTDDPAQFVSTEDWIQALTWAESDHCDWFVASSEGKGSLPETAQDALDRGEPVIEVPPLVWVAIAAIGIVGAVFWPGLSRWFRRTTT